VVVPGGLLAPQRTPSPLEQFALSTQCEFASAGPGSQISEDVRQNKLRLVAEVADRVWGIIG